MEQMKLKTPDIRKTECVTILTLQQKLKLMTEITFGVIGGNLLSLTLAIFVYTLLAPSYGDPQNAMAAFAAIVTATLPILAVNYRCRIVPKYGMAAFYSIVCASASDFLFLGRSGTRNDKTALRSRHCTLHIFGYRLYRYTLEIPFNC